MWSVLAVVPPPSCAEIVDSVVQCMHNAEALPSITALSITHPCLGPIRESKATCASTAWRDAVHDAASLLSPSVAVRCTKAPGLHSSDGGGARWEMGEVGVGLACSCCCCCCCCCCYCCCYCCSDSWWIKNRMCVCLRYAGEHHKASLAWLRAGVP